MTREQYWQNRPHQRAELRDDLRMIFQAMTNTQLMIAYLRELGWTDPDIGETLGMTARAVAANMSHAKRAISRKYPDLANHLDRRRRTWKKARTDNDG